MSQGLEDPETSPDKPAEEWARPNPTPQTAPEAEEAADAGSALPAASDVSEVDLEAAPFAQERTFDSEQVEAQSGSDPAAGTGTGRETDQLSVGRSEASSRHADSLETNAPSNTRDKRTPFTSVMVPLEQIEFKPSTDPNALMIDDVLHPSGEDRMLLNKGILPLLGLFPPQGFFRKDAFVAVYDPGGLIARARHLLDGATPIPVVVYRSAAAVKPIALRELSLYWHLLFTPTREGSDDPKD